MVAPRMQAMQLDAPGERLHLVARPLPAPGPGDLLVEIAACGVCRTDLHIVDGDLHGPTPIVPGHEIVGRVGAVGARVEAFSIGDRVGIPWLGGTCGRCEYCRTGRENLCDRPVFTGFTRDGGFATHVVADAGFCLRLPDTYGDREAAPLLCAGLIGWRSLKAASQGAGQGAGQEAGQEAGHEAGQEAGQEAGKAAGQASPLGLYGFGAAAHIIAQVAVWQGRQVFAFTRPGDASGQAFARSLGCAWAGDSTEAPPEPMAAAIIFAPVGALVPEALRHVRKGGRVVCAGIHMTDIPPFPYADLWGERSIVSVANLTRADGNEFLELAGRIGLKTATTGFPLAEANEALDAVRAGAIEGAAVLLP